MAEHQGGGRRGEMTVKQGGGDEGHVSAGPSHGASDERLEVRSTVTRGTRRDVRSGRKTRRAIKLEKTPRYQIHVPNDSSRCVCAGKGPEITPAGSSDVVRPIPHKGCRQNDT